MDNGDLERSAALTKQTRELARTFFDACNRHDLPAILDLLHEDCIHYSRLSQYPKEGVAFAYEVTWNAFPDLKWNVLEIIADEDRMATLTLIEGTHQGEYLGAAGTGKRFKMHSVDVARVADGKIIEHRGVLDELNLLAQIGVVPDTFLAQMS